jgi:uncharacterized membrane protein YuzA (DUF378 family)
MKRLNGIDGLTLILVIIGAINWGLVGLFNYNVVDAIFGAGSTAARVVYTLVGLSGIYLAIASQWFGKATRSIEDRIDRSNMHHPHQAM